MTEERRGAGGRPGVGDMGAEEFRAAAHRVADLAADYLERVPTYRVLPDVAAGFLRRVLPGEAPAEPEPLEEILGDYLRWIEPHVTHWQHPGFLAYFPSAASGPGILGEWLSAALNSNVMLWRNAPASTELEETVVAWLRRAFGLPEAFDGMLTDTASVSSLLSVVAARQAVPGLEAREEGLAGRAGVPALRLYCSEEAHSSIEKAAVVAGIGRRNVVRIPVDGAYRMRVDELARAIAGDRAAGRRPFCVVATAGTTSSTSVDPLAEAAGICEREGLWLHIDAAYAGSAAIVPELRPLLAGWERADSIVVNPHKWLMTPFDASLLLFRRPETYREAFSVVPEYLRTRREGEAHDFHEYGIQLGRRFRALKLWFLLRWFGTDGLAARLREHCRLARELASWVAADGDWEVLAPVPFATVCLRYRPRGWAEREGEPGVRNELDAWNQAILEAVNRSGRIFLSHTRLGGRFAIRVSIGNPRSDETHVRLCWELLREAAAAVQPNPPGAGE